jgi:hypothetical protein
VSQVRTVPATAGALLVGGQIHRHTSVRGEIAPDLHPLVRRVLNALPVTRRERYLGWCAEPVLISDRLYAASDGASASLSEAAARSALAGARLVVTRIRESGDPAHGTPQPPCRSCAALLDHFGVSVIDVRS